MNVEKGFYDLVIVGAGPAGLTASLYAQRFGIEYVIVEKSNFPKDKVCGDAIVPLAFRIMEELDILPDPSKFHRVNQMELKFSDGTNASTIINTYPEQLKVFNSKRIAFDEFLKDKDGTEKHLLYAEAKSVEPEANCVVIGQGGGVERKVGYKNLLLCTGSGKEIFLKSRENKLHSTLVASRAYIEVENAGDKNFVEFFKEVSPGYFWAFPVASNVLNTGVLAHDNENISKLYDIHAKKLREYFQLKSDVEYTRWTLKVYPNREVNNYKNIAVIGDANHSIEPVLGHGIDMAMLEAREQIFAIKNTGSVTHQSPIYAEIKKRGELSLSFKQKVSSNYTAESVKVEFEKLMEDAAVFYHAIGTHLNQCPAPWKNEKKDKPSNTMNEQKEKLHSQLDREGYAVVDILNEEEISYLKQIVAKFQFSYGGNVNREKLRYDNTFFELDIELKKTFYKTLNDFFQPKLDSLLNDYDILITNLWEKKPGDAEVIVHQNWTHVDESKFRSYSIWIPLQDANTENGTMEVVPRSHKKFSSMRGLNMEYPYSYPFKPIEKEIKDEFLVPLNLKTGQAAIFDDALIHYTGSNLSNAMRVAVQLVVKPKAAEGLFYFKHKEITGVNNVEIFEADPDFYSHLHLITGANTRPEYGISKGFTTHHTTLITIEDFRKKMQSRQLHHDTEKQPVKNIFEKALSAIRSTLQKAY